MERTVTPNTTSAAYTHRDHPEWGRAIVLQERNNKLDLPFEDGQMRTFVKGDARLVLVESPDDLTALNAKLRGRSSKSAAKAGKKKPTASREAKGTLYPTFAAQLAAFEGLFPGGFTGEKFVAEERGQVDVKSKKAVKAAAIAQAQQAFEHATFEKTSEADLFETAKQLMKATNIVFPIEGAIPFGQMKEEARPGLIKALGELLHGSGGYSNRFNTFVESMRLTDSAGKVRRPTWPTITVLSALFDPVTHVAVKPTVFENQAKLLGMSLHYESLPSGESYQQFLQVARATEAKLKEAGHAPRDLMDIYSFISTTHNVKPPAAVAKV
jgi:hypothetical protein